MNIAVIIDIHRRHRCTAIGFLEGNINLTLVKAIVTLEPFTWIYKGRIASETGNEGTCFYREKAQGRDEYKVAGPFRATYLRLSVIAAGGGYLISCVSHLFYIGTSRLKKNGQDRAG